MPIRLRAKSRNFGAGHAINKGTIHVQIPCLATNRIGMHTFMTTPKSNPGKSPSKPKPQPGRQEAPPTELLRTRFSARQLQRHFAKLLTASWLATWLELSERAFYQRAYMPLITLWYLLFQRLSDNHTLSHVVEDAREGGRSEEHTSELQSLRHLVCR